MIEGKSIKSLRHQKLVVMKSQIIKPKVMKQASSIAFGSGSDSQRTKVHNLLQNQASMPDIQKYQYTSLYDAETKLTNQENHLSLPCAESESARKQSSWNDARTISHI
jgi:hypothetical protein